MNKSQVDIVFREGESPLVKVKSGPYEGLAFVLGAVSFPDENKPIMRFNYDIIQGKFGRTQMLEQEIGDLIQELILERLQDKTLIYANGT